MGVRSLFSDLDWHMKYNIACAYAIALNSPCGADARDALAGRAIEYLEKAVLTSRRCFAILEPEWVVEEDPDLKALREGRSGRFVEFIRSCYPGVDSPNGEYGLVLSVEQLRKYDYRLLEETARVMRRMWRRRGDADSVDIDVATAWLSVESQIWEEIHEIADVEHERRWRDRVKLIRCLEDNFYPSSIGLSNFPPQLFGISHDDHVENLSSAQVDRRLKDLKDYMEADRDVDSYVSLDGSFSNKPPDTPYFNSQQGGRILRDAAASGSVRLDADRTRRLATRYGAAWQRLSDWLALEDGQQRFSEAIGDVANVNQSLVEP
ncbi:hypothetical protein [Streptomyces sp. NEAU-174]|uniref:hypothetical protein n=1 Tax=Streptomyces sp. NEAU-174 TaxID=3458254 RepID=UPI0040450494